MTNRSCQVPGCQGKYLAKGFCAKHYQANRMKRLKTDVKTDIETMREETAATAERVCKEPGCQRAYYAKGYCVTHYQKNRLMRKNTSPVEAATKTMPSAKKIGLSTGITRQLDNLGRIVLPIELRRSLDIEVSDSLEIFVDQDMLILRKYAPGCIFCGQISMDNVYFKGKIICRDCSIASKEIKK